MAQRPDRKRLACRRREVDRRVGRRPDVEAAARAIHCRASPYSALDSAVAGWREVVEMKELCCNWETAARGIRLQRRSVFWRYTEPAKLR